MNFIRPLASKPRTYNLQLSTYLIEGKGYDMGFVNPQHPDL